MTSDIPATIIHAAAEVEYDTHLDEPCSIEEYVLIAEAELGKYVVVDVGSGTSL